MTSSLPVCGPWQTLALLSDPAAFTAGRGLALGTAYRVRLPGQRLLVVTDPDWVETVLVREADSFAKSRIYWRMLRRMIGDSLGSLDDARWAYLHRIERPFFTPRAVDGYMARVAEVTTEHLARVGRTADGAASVPVLASLAELNARILLDVLFDRPSEPRVAEIARRIVDGHEIVAWMSKYPWRPALALLNGATRRAREHGSFFDTYVRGLRSEAAEGDPKENLMRALMAVGDDPEAPPLSPGLLRNEIMFHLGAAIETQGAAEAWALHLLWKHPEALARLRHEVDVVTGGAPVGPAHVASLGWARCVVQEALRLYPPVHGILRDCVRPVEVGSYRVRAGETVLVSVYGMHRSQRLWEEPDGFLPERFHPSAPPVPKHRYLPFGAGRHVCIGRHLALPGMVLLVAGFARGFEWSFADPDVRPDPRPSLKPPAPFEMHLTRRPGSEVRAGEGR